MKTGAVGLYHLLILHSWKLIFLNLKLSVSLDVTFNENKGAERTYILGVSCCRFGVFFCDKVFPGSPGWPATQEVLLPQPPSQSVGSQVCTTTPGQHPALWTR